MSYGRFGCSEECSRTHGRLMNEAAEWKARATFAEARVAKVRADLSALDKIRQMAIEWATQHNHDEATDRQIADGEQILALIRGAALDAGATS